MLRRARPTGALPCADELRSHHVPTRQVPRSSAAPDARRVRRAPRRGTTAQDAPRAGCRGDGALRHEGVRGDDGR
ncbi:hypothetical protein NKH18_43380 [Streptomyces sp. M10(2022)]